jgi:cobalt/nickel transport system permease protein
LFKKNDFIERSILGALSFLKDSVLADDIASRRGLLQALDPRVKAITILLILIQVLLAKSIVVILCIYGLCLLLSVLSNIRLSYFLKRTWFFIPIFSFFIVIPALFSGFTPGNILYSRNIAGLQLAITSQGLSGALLFVARVTTCVSLAVLLSITTRHSELLKVLRVFRIPQIYVMTLGMCYRYIFLFVGILENTYIAIKSRIGKNIHYKKGQHVVAWNIGNLWIRSYHLNEDVYKAMLSRGYGGEAFAMDDFRFKVTDAAWSFAVLAGSVLLWSLGHIWKVL